MITWSPFFLDFSGPSFFRTGDRIPTFNLPPRFFPSTCWPRLEGNLPFLRPPPPPLPPPVVMVSSSPSFYLSLEWLFWRGRTGHARSVPQRWNLPLISRFRGGVMRILCWPLSRRPSSFPRLIGSIQFPLVTARWSVRLCRIELLFSPLPTRFLCLGFGAGFRLGKPFSFRRHRTYNFQEQIFRICGFDGYVSVFFSSLEHGSMKGRPPHRGKGGLVPPCGCLSLAPSF